MRIQAVSNSSRIRNRVHFLQFVRRSYKLKAGRRETPYLPIGKLDHEDPTSTDERTYYTKPNSGEWHVDSATHWSPFYEYLKKAPTSKGRVGNLYELSIYDRPGLFKYANFDSQTVEFKTYVLYGEKFLYQIDWKRFVERDKNGNWEPPEYKITKSRKIETAVPDDLPVNVYQSDWFWYYEDKELTKRLTVPNERRERITRVRDNN
jgi:hypothetical protein